MNDEGVSGRVCLVPRRLTLTEATRLHEELKTTPNILGYTVRELLRFSSVLVAGAMEYGNASRNGGVFAGACISKDLLFGWTDIAALYVLPAFRGQGIGTLLYTAAFADARERGRHVFTLSRCPETIRMMERAGMEMTRSMWKAPLAVHLHRNGHMMSRYRLREAVRKAGMRAGDGGAFVAGTKRFRAAEEKGIR